MKYIAFLLLLLLLGLTSSRAKYSSVNFEVDYHDLIVNYPSDSSISSAINFARSFVVDSLKSRPKNFQFTHSAASENGIHYNIIQLYDERNVIKEKSGLDDNLHYRLNQIVQLYFTNDLKFVKSMRVVDSDRENVKFNKTLNKY